jgi:hypothetical protein
MDTYDEIVNIIRKFVPEPDATQLRRLIVNLVQEGKTTVLAAAAREALALNEGADGGNSHAEGEEAGPREGATPPGVPD